MGVYDGIQQAILILTNKKFIMLDDINYQKIAEVLWAFNDIVNHQEIEIIYPRTSTQSASFLALYLIKQVDKLSAQDDSIS